MPTAIVVNILAPEAIRDGLTLHPKDAIAIDDASPISRILLPDSFSDKTWMPQSLYPLEVIDGQHRLWAFEDYAPSGTFELPVIAFYDLDRSWQAYLFWSINITPKRINKSLAFDLYPLLRHEEWLNRFTGHSIYRETRCQELVEALWSHPNSPWCQRINMLGETEAARGNKVAMVSQAAWIRSLMATFVKEWPEHGLGGLFGAARGKNDLRLPWTRAMQTAFLLLAGRELQLAVAASNDAWAKKLRSIDDPTLFEMDDDRAFFGRHSLLTTDQGIRGWLHITNDLCYAAAESLDLANWEPPAPGKSEENDAAATDEVAVNRAIRSLQKTSIKQFLASIASTLASYDWRTSSTPSLTEAERNRQAVFRGSSGYKELRIQLLAHVARHATDANVKRNAEQVLSTIRDT